jgi:hypothetical protein
MSRGREEVSALMRPGVPNDSVFGSASISLRTPRPSSFSSSAAVSVHRSQADAHLRCCRTYSSTSPKPNGAKIRTMAGVNVPKTGHGGGDE